jgi:hypothetical protein
MEKLQQHSTPFAIFSNAENRQHLRKNQINLHFRSVCTIFADAFP